MALICRFEITDWWCVSAAVSACS